MRAHSEGDAPALPGRAVTAPSPSGRFTDKADMTALLGAFCFLLSAIEYMLPKPMPFMRLGIANLPILLAVDLLPFPWFLTLALVKVIGMSVISGSLFSYVALFSLAGTMTAAIVMWGARKLGGKLISQIGVSILGAMASNAVQIFIARWLVFGEAAWLIAPLFLAMGLVTGTALGLFAEHFAARSTWFALASGRPAAEAWSPSESGVVGEGSGQADSSGAAKPGRKGEAVLRGAQGRASARARARAEKASAGRAGRRKAFEASFSPFPAALSGAVLAVAFLFEGNLAVKAALFALFAAAVVLAGKRFSFPTMLIVSAGIVLANLLVPSGRVLFSLGPLAVTQFALTDGVVKALTFEGLMLISKASIMPGLRLPGRLGGIVASAFLYYDRIIEYKGKVRAASLASDSDAMMRAVWEDESLEPQGIRAAPDPRPRAAIRKGDIALAAVTAAVAIVSILV
jgi:heptaprenyl diphosphate synthase